MMTLRKVALVGIGTLAPACVQVFELEPVGDEGLAIPAPVEVPLASPGTELHGTADEQQLSPPASGGPTPARNDSPEEVLLPGEAPAAPDGGLTPVVGCNKIDFLFMIDNSLSMLQEQSNLTASFPGFMQVVGESVQASDHHVMVIDTDGWDGEGTQASAEACEDTIGAGKRSSSDGEDCGIVGARRYIEPGQPDLEGVFSCLGDVGTFGDFGEQQMDAVLRAVSPAENASTGCNAGFLRDDAILVVVLVTDEDDTRSAGGAEAWRQALVDAKSGDERAVVVLGLVGDDNVEGGLPGGPCPRLGVSSGAPELQRFVQSLPLGSLASVCADNYAPFFEQAVSSIQSACDDFSAPLR
jgi:hypothetical protein